ncbi:glycosyltransferase [Microbacterium sp.]|uniref:glycosyltransferase n=1 Tax=Microbacterium sp. TaxID=51671 RepID=UPI003C781A50
MTHIQGSASPAPWCTIITVAYNSARTLEHFWTPGIEGIEWVVVDNASTDDSVAVATRLGATVIRLHRNHGFSYANNVGYQIARSNFIGFVNPDIRLTSDSLHILDQVAEEAGAIVGPQLRNADGTLQPNGRGFPTLSAKVRNRLRGDDPAYLLSSDNERPRPVVWLMGAAVFGHRAQFDQFGVWDPHFFLYYEDSDLGLRSWEARVPVLLVPTAEMEHGWARETSGRFRFTPWRREIASLTKFYSRYPSLLLPRRLASIVHTNITRAVFGPREATHQ